MVDKPHDEDVLRLRVGLAYLREYWCLAMDPRSRTDGARRVMLKNLREFYRQVHTFESTGLLFKFMISICCVVVDNARHRDLQDELFKSSWYGEFQRSQFSKLVAGNISNAEFERILLGNFTLIEELIMKPKHSKDDILMALLSFEP